jgi:hypothetical protein
MLGCSKRASVRASVRKLERPQSNVDLCLFDLGRTVHGSAVAVAEIEGVILLDGDAGGEVDVLGLVGNAEAALADYPDNAVAGVEQRVCRQRRATVQGILFSQGS